MLLIEIESSEHHQMPVVGLFGFRIENRLGTGDWWRSEADHL